MAESDLRYRPFVVLLALGFLVRTVLMFAYFPSVMLWADAIRHTRIVPPEIFGDPWMPAGYAMWLALLHLVTHQLWFAIVLQHLMGLSVGVMFFLVMCRLGAAPWLATIAAAVPLLSGDHLYLEHIVMSDYLLVFLTMSGLTFAIFAFGEEVNIVQLCVASALLGLACLVRNVGIILFPILAICAFLWAPRMMRARAAALAAAVLPAFAIVAVYCVARLGVHGEYLGFADMRGWDLYARVAPFADCRKFVPPVGTNVLCEDVPPAQRYGSLGYIWDEKSIVRCNFPLWPTSQKMLGDFALQAITHQPGDYAFRVFNDLLRYIDPALGDKFAYGGQTPEIMSFGWRDVAVEHRVVQELSKKYHKTKVHLHGGKWLAAYQNLFRVSGLVLIALLVSTCVGMIRAHGRLRLGIFLFGLIAFELYLVPVMTLSYDFRYGIPAETFLVVSGLLAATVLPGRVAKHSA